MTVKRMDNVGLVVEDLDAAITFFEELGLTLEGRMPIEGEWGVAVVVKAVDAELARQVLASSTEIAAVDTDGVSDAGL